MIVESASSTEEQVRKTKIAKLVFEEDELLKGKELLTFRDRIEEKILDALLDNPGYKNAFEKLPRNT